MTGEVKKEMRGKDADAEAQLQTAPKLPNHMASQASLHLHLHHSQNDKMQAKQDVRTAEVKKEMRGKDAELVQINQGVIRGWTIIATVLFLAYILELVKGARALP